MVEFVYLSLIYIIPTLILYCITLFVIFRNQTKSKFGSSFYWIFGFSAINYVIHAICYFILYRFTKISALFSFFKSLPSAHFLYPFIYGASFYTFYATNIYTLAISFNRFTIFLLKAEYNSFWSRNLKYILGICIGIPLILVWNFPFIAIQNRPIEGYGAYLVSTNPEFASWWQASRNSVIEICVTSILTLAMNVFVIFSMLKRRCYESHSSVNISQKDMALIPYSLLIFSMEIVNCVQQLLLVIDRTTFLPLVMSVQFIFVDISDLAPIWFILVTNKQLRKAVIALFWKEKAKIFVTSVKSMYS